jgi:bifunctional UDP-N-acetylglucosamine pyrophosphorylase/glucosamine-1-phosphate N-acetyltransferase
MASSAFMDVVILAAGKGTRMRSALPKVLQPLAGRPLLAHVIDTARALSARRICVVHGHGADAVREAMQGDDLLWALQSPQLGTGHAVQQAMPLLDGEGTVLVLYGDVPLMAETSLRRLLAVSGPEVLGLLTVTLDDPQGYGRIVRDGAGRVLRIVEQKDASADERAIREVNTGILAAPAARLRAWLARLSNDNAQGEYYLTDIIAMAVADGVSIQAVSPDSATETLGVNDKQQLAGLERAYQLQQANRLLEQGVTLLDPARFDLRGQLTCGQDVEIDVGCVFEGQVELGDRVRIGPHCVIRNARIGAGTQIAAFSHVDHSQIGEACVIGPYARTRPGTVLGREVHVGNFVEIKNSHIDDASKANHLAYVGDADVGKRVNIGAGTITCNYDGANKYRTTIGDDAFIGSDTQLVAPVSVGAGATLGAGTTLSKDAPAGQLTVSRARQISLPNWKRPVKKTTP